MITLDIIKSEKDVDRIIADNNKVVNLIVDESVYTQAIEGERLILGWVDDTKVYGKILNKHRYPREKWVPISYGGVECSTEYTCYLVFELLVNRKNIYWKP